MNHPNVAASLLTIFDELTTGAAPGASWVLNPKDPGLFASLDRLSAKEASEVPPGSTSSVAAHVDHLLYGMGLLNRWSHGENPFSDADYRPSWERLNVSEEEWRLLLEKFKKEASAWRRAMETPREISEFESTGVVASVVHLAYHLGAIRQLQRAARGPSAKD